MASVPSIDPPMPIIAIVLNFLNFFISLILKLNLYLLFKTCKVLLELLISLFIEALTF